MSLNFNGNNIGAVQYGGVTIGEAMIDGQIVYRSARYPLTGTFNIVNGATLTAVEVFSHTVVEPGNFTGTVTQESGEVTVWAWLVSGRNSTFGTTQTFTGLSVGDTITLSALHTGALNVSGTWSLTKEEFSVITVTPQAPTFLTASPWYTLPTQAGVTYTVSGTPGYSQSVTITATPQAGYALAGQTSWTHTYPSFYPVSGTWPTQSGSGTGYSTFATHTIAEAGTYTINLAVLNQSASFGQNINARISGPWGTNTGNLARNGSTSTVSTTRALSPGNVIHFQASGTQAKSGSWSIVKN